VSWRQMALCQNYDPSWWFHEADNMEQHRGARKMCEVCCAARAICIRCPVREACLEEALKNNEKIGCWAGLWGDGLATLRRERAIQPALWTEAS
jgi:WhiB family transcriptional regulator, redox-sensing transcriptional regulator